MLAFRLGLAGGALLVFAAGLLLEPTPRGIAIFGRAVEVPCFFRALTGIPCPGCGLTRSFVYTAHGDLSQALSQHLAGPVAAAGLLLFAVYQLIRAAEAARGRPPIPLAASDAHVAAALFLLAALFAANWCFHLLGRPI